MRYNASHAVFWFRCRMMTAREHDEDARSGSPANLRHRTRASAHAGHAVAVGKLSGTVCIAGGGGGWDFTCRVPAAQLMQKLNLIDGSMKVVNMSVSGGGKAFAYVVTSRNEDEKLIVAASAATATRLAQKVYGDFKADDVRWVGALGMDYGVIVVKKDSPYRTLDDLVNQFRTNPRKAIVVGGSSAGG